MIDEATAKYMAEQKVFLTPTLVTYFELGAADGFLPPEMKVKNDAVLQAGFDSLKTASEAGVIMYYGTDLLGHVIAAQTRESTLRAKVLTPLQVLQSATTNATLMLGQTKFLGRIAEGFAADMVILNSNPLEDITILDAPTKHLLAVVKEGRVHVSRWSKLPTDTPPFLVQIE